MLSRAIMIASVATAGVLATAEAQAQSADAVLVDSDGKTIGNVALSQLERGVRLFAQATDLPPGQHAFHIHETGECGAPDFESAGGHFNPTDEQHGWDNPQGYHAGDFPNIHVQDDGRLAVEYFTDAVTLREGEETSLFDDDGSAIVIHAGADDYRTDPAGAAGERIACGVISPSG
jgi:superoxide dismutase, Cu-Zn family